MKKKVEFMLIFWVENKSEKFWSLKNLPSPRFIEPVGKMFVAIN